MWNLKSASNRFKWTYLQNRNKLRDIENKLTVIKRKRGEDKLGIRYKHIQTTVYKTGVPGGSVGKEFTCNAGATGDTCSVSGS